MKIFLIGSDPRQGLLYYPSKIAIELKKHGNEVHVGTWGNMEQTPGLFKKLYQNSIKIHKCDFLHQSGIKALIYPINGHRDVIKIISPDIIHTFGPVSLFQLRKLIPQTKKIKCVSMIAAMGHASRNNFGAKIGAKILNRYADLVIAQCFQEKERLIQVGTNPNKIKVLYPPMDCKEFLILSNSNSSKKTIKQRYNLPENTKLLGCFSNFQYRKRHDLILRAFASLGKSTLKWALVMAGEGPERFRSEMLSKQLRLGTKAIYLNRIPTSEMPGLLNTVNAVVHASNAETFGYSMVEPLLFRKPTLITNIGIGYEIEKDKKAVVIKPDSLEELIQGMKRIMNPDAKVKSMMKTSRDYVMKTFDMPIIVKQLITLYSSL